MNNYFNNYVEETSKRMRNAGFPINEASLREALRELTKLGLIKLDPITGNVTFNDINNGNFLSRH